MQFKMTLDEHLSQNIPPITGLCFLFFTWLGMITFKLLSKAMPKTAEILFLYFKKNITCDLEKKVELLTKEVTVYKEQKHAVESENKTLRQAIRLDDPEVRKAVLKVIDKDNEKNQ